MEFSEPAPSGHANRNGTNPSESCKTPDPRTKRRNAEDEGERCSRIALSQPLPYCRYYHVLLIDKSSAGYMLAVTATRNVCGQAAA